MKPKLAPVLALLTLLFSTATSSASDTGTAVVRIVAEPPLAAGTFGFAGTPTGEVRLAPDRDSLSAEGLAAGGYASTLAAVDPNVAAAGYRLVDIRCDDPASSGDLAGAKANFAIQPGKTVTCVFALAVSSACLCPKEGTWNVNNLPGQMVCTGAMSMTLPLAPSSGAGTLKIEDDCATIVAAGLSEGEGTMTMRRNASCGYEGSFGGSHEGLPMTIDFVWTLASDDEIAGSLHSEVSQQGMTCIMTRDFEMNFAQ